MRDVTIACLLLLAGCQPGRPDQPDVQLVVNAPNFAQWPAPFAGWDGWPVPTPVVREWVWQPRIRRTPAQWVPRDTAVPWNPGVGTLVAPDGTEVPLREEFHFGTSFLLGQDGDVPPGEYDLRVVADSFEERIPGFDVSEHGQIAEFDPAALDGRIHSLVLPLTSLMSLGDLIPQLHVRAVPAGDRVAQVSIWAEGDQVPLCRAWQGDLALSDSGVAALDVGELTTEGLQSIRFTDLSLKMGFNADASEVAGIQLSATVDARQIDPLITPEDEDVVEGDTCRLLASLGLPCGPCAETLEPFCFGFEARQGYGEAWTEAETLAKAGADDLESIDDAPLCGGPADGSIAVCSTVGTVGMGAWLVGLGLVLFRRRRPTQR